MVEKRQQSGQIKPKPTALKYVNACYNRVSAILDFLSINAIKQLII
jgi:hypothetical protein